MKKLLFYVSAFILLLGITGCGRKNYLPDTYVEESDFQYMRQGSMDLQPDMQKGEKGYYFRHDAFIYYLDEETEKLLPLCNRVDCLHDMETEPARYETCNAYVQPYGGQSCSTGFEYYKGYLYYIAQSYEGMETILTLYRLSEDGAEKEQIYQWKEVYIMDWMIHRGIFYYSEGIFEESDSEDEVVEEYFFVKAIDLTKVVKRPKTIFEPSREEIDYMGIQWLTAYGNYLYFLVTGNGAGYEKVHIYNIKNGNVSELALEGHEEENISSVVFWQDHILFSLDVFDVNDMEYSSFTPKTWYMANLDGSNSQVFMEDVLSGYSFRSDGEYLYVTNSFIVTRDELGLMEYNEKKTFWVYDKEKQLVDTFLLPDEIKDLGLPPIGDPQRMCTVYKDDTEWGVLYWDKSQIGNCNGGAPQLKKIPYSF